MKTARNLLTGLILAAGVSGMAIAYGGPGMKGGCDGMGPGKMGRQAAMKFDPAERANQRLAYLKEQLRITAAQEPLWNAFAEQARARAAQGMKGMRDPADANLPAPERMAKRHAAMEQHLAGMREVHERFARLYDALTPEQQAIADREMGRMGKGGTRGGPAMRG